MKASVLKPFVNINNMILGDILAMVPKSLGPNDGEIWVAIEDEEKVYSINSGPTPKVCVIVEIPKAGNVSVIPHEPEEFGDSEGAYFAADWMMGGGRILECPKSAFNGLGGNVLVAQETGGGIFIIKWDDIKYEAISFDGKLFQGNAEGAIFVHHYHHHHHRDDANDEY